MKHITSKPQYLVVAASLLISIVAAFYFFDMANANGDTIARLNIARRVVASSSPGFSQLGYVWLPASSVLMLPFIWADSLYYSGVAGIIISMLSFVAASYFIYMIGATIINRTAGVFAFLLFALNPNTLYMQSTSLTEMFYIASVLGAVYWALQWAREQKHRYLAASGIFFFLATLSRYDGWFFAAVALLSVALYELLVTRNWRRVEGTVVMFAMIAFFGVFLWVVWNYIIFGDALYFARGEYSAKFQQQDLLNNNMLPSYYNIRNAALHTFWASELTLGWALLVVGLMGAIYMTWELFTARRLRYLFVLILGAQILYYIINLYGGNGVIYVPQLYPHKMHNIRYAMTFVPFFAIAAAVVAARTRFVGAALVAIVVAEYAAMGVSGNIITLNESIDGFAGRTAHASRIEAGQWLRKNYDDGALLIDIFNNDSIPFTSRIADENWVNVSDPALYGRAMQSPGDVVSWVIVRENDLMAERFLDGSYLEEDFYCVYHEDDVTIYRKKWDENYYSVDCGVKPVESGSLAISSATN